MASLSACKSAVISQCHLSFPFTLGDNNARVKEDKEASVYVLYGLSVALSTVLLSTALKCVLIWSEAIWALEAIMITLFVPRSSTKFTECWEGWEKKGRRLKVRRVKTGEK